MEIKEINNKEIWENFLLGGCEEKTFLDSWNWGEFQKMMGNKIWRVGTYQRQETSDKRQELIGTALVIKVVAKRGTFLLVPHGPSIISNFQFLISKQNVLKILLEKLKEIAQEEKVDFIRISPILERSEENNEIFRKLAFKNAPIHAHPEASWKLDIRPSEEELLMGMRKTTRYLIRQAEKNKGIEIFQSSKTDDVETFNKLYQEVVKSQHFIPFSLEYLKNEFLAFQPNNQISLFFGKYKGEIVASAFVIFWSKIGFYHHAALLPEYHKIPIAYFLQWEAIKEAKKRGCTLYDFWGYVNPEKNPKHPWAGPTLFKMGFGGYKKEYVKTQDFILGGGWMSFKKYWLTFIFEKLRKTKRGL